MLEVVLAAVRDCAGLGSPASGPRVREPAVAPSTRRPDASYTIPTTCSASPMGQAAVDPGSPLGCWLARASDLRHTRHGCALASTGLAPVLALEVPLSW